MEKDGAEVSIPMSPGSLQLLRLDTGKSITVFSDPRLSPLDCQFATDSSGFACRLGPSRVGEGAPLPTLRQFPLLAWSVSQCLSGACAPFGTASNVYQYTYLSISGGASALLWLQDATAPQGTFQGSGVRGTLYLAGDASRWTTGTAVIVDGGYCAP